MRPISTRRSDAPDVASARDLPPTTVNLTEQEAIAELAGTFELEIYGALTRANIEAAIAAGTDPQWSALLVASRERNPRTIGEAVFAMLEAFVDAEAISRVNRQLDANKRLSVIEAGEALARRRL